MTWTDRKLRGCAQAGCHAAPSDDHNLCPRHRADHNRRQRASKRQRQAMREAQLPLLST
jgi:hypothetical protein